MSALRYDLTVFAIAATITVLCLCGLGISASLCMPSSMKISTGVYFWLSLLAMIGPPFIWTRAFQARLRLLKDHWRSECGTMLPECVMRSEWIRFSMLAVRIQMVGLIIALLTLTTPFARFQYALTFAPGVIVVGGGLLARLLARPDIRLAASMREMATQDRRPCIACGYDCSFIRSTRCPECGCRIGRPS